MDCCAAQTKPASVQVGKREFLEGKLRNFRVYLLQYATTDEQKASLDTYTDVAQVLPMLAQLIPLQRAGKLGVAVDGFTKAFCTEDPAFKVKVKRYLECFTEVLQQD